MSREGCRLRGREKCWHSCSFQSRGEWEGVCVRVCVGGCVYGVWEDVGEGGCVWCWEGVCGVCTLTRLKYMYMF